MNKTKSLLSFLLSAILVFSLLVPAAAASSSKLIPDPILEQGVRDQLWELPENEELTKEHLESIEELYVWEYQDGVKDLTGIENAKNLISFYLWAPDKRFSNGHQISDLTPLSKLNKLTYLALDNAFNDSKKVDLSPIGNIKSLESLSLNYNDLKNKDLQPLENLTNLTSLELWWNNLTSFENIPTNNLVYLSVYNNNFTSLDGLEFDVTSDVYYQFDFSYNQINDISALTGIKNAYINLDFNNVVDLTPLKDMQNGSLLLYNNKNLNSKSLDILRTLEERGVFIVVDFELYEKMHGDGDALAINTDNKRVSGASRYHTAVDISKHGWEDNSAKTVVISTGDSFPDALAGASLANILDAPILLTGSNLHDVTKQEIERLGAEKAIVLGGNAAVSNNVVKELKGLGLDVERISGSGRYETAVQVAEELSDVTGTPNTAVIAYGLDFPDALSIAPYAAKNGFPILLTEKDKLSKATKEYLNENKNIKNIIIVGGTGVISKNVEKELKGFNVERIAGQHRFDTAAKIANKFGSPSKAYIANGSSFADALTGAVLAAKEGTPLLLVETDKLPSATQTAIFKNGIQDFTFLGGNAVISEKLKNQILK